MALWVRDLTVRYGQFIAVRGADLEIADGEALALLGPSGSGKSTLLRAIAGLEPIAGGTLRWDGTDLARVPVHRRGFGLVFQDGQLFPHRDVAGNIAFGLRMKGTKAPDRVGELLRLVGLSGYERRRVIELSGGEVNGSPWHARSRQNPGSCCSTSHCPVWTPACVSISPWTWPRYCVNRRSPRCW